MSPDKTKKILAIIPARGGSKGIPRKNLQKIGNYSLVALAVKCAINVSMIDRTIISTDSLEIGSEAEAFGATFPFIRPKKLSGDTSSDIDVIHHALLEMEKIDGCTYDVIVFLQPTSPTRTPELLVKIINHFFENNYDALWTISPTNDKYHAFKQIVMNKSSGTIKYMFDEGNQMLPRQLLPNTFHVNGIAYVLSRECVVTQKSRLGKSTGAFVINDTTINIDSIDDLEVAREYFRRKK